MYKYMHVSVTGVKYVAQCIMCDSIVSCERVYICHFVSVNGLDRLTIAWFSARM